MRLRAVSALAMSAALGAGLAAPAAAQSDPLNVVATIGMIADVTETVAGACAAVTTMMGPGIDPHVYQATAGDVQALSRAELILYSGFGLEGQLGDVLERFGEQTPTLAVAPNSIPTAELIAVDDLYGIDPHVWMDVSLWAMTVPTIAGAVADLVPECAADIQANAARYTAHLAALHDWVGEAIATIPEDMRILVTAHDAFGYYARAYGIDVEAIQGVSTEAEAAIADIRDTATILVETGIPAIFVETTINPRTIEAVIEAAEAQGHAVEIGGELHSDAMGDAGTPGGSYIGMIFENTSHIVSALGGAVPPLPPELADWAGQWNLATRN